MKRIDTVNARENMFGVGKSGFHDNADLPGQDATYVSPEWFNAIQEELCNLLELNNTSLDPQSNRQLYDLFTKLFNNSDQTRRLNTLVLNTTYTNTSKKPWFVSMTTKNTSSGQPAFLQLKVDGNEVAVSQDVATSYNSGSNVYVAYVTIEQIILPGESFIFENSSLGRFHCSSEIS